MVYEIICRKALILILIGITSSIGLLSVFALTDYAAKPIYNYTKNDSSPYFNNYTPPGRDHPYEIVNMSGDHKAPVTNFINFSDSNHIYFRGRDNAKIDHYECNFGYKWQVCKSPVSVKPTSEKQVLQVRSIDINNNTEETPAIVFYSKG